MPSNIPPLPVNTGQESTALVPFENSPVYGKYNRTHSIA